LVASKADYINFSSQINLLAGNNSINISLVLIAPAANLTNSTVNSTSNNSTSNSTNPTNNNTMNSTQNSTVSGDIVAVSQLGYHPLSIKEVVVYTNSLNGNFNIRDANTNAIIISLPLQKPENYAGSNVNCQGNLPCLTGDFTNFTNQGTYYIEENGIKSHTFIINQNVFSSTIPLFFEFFNAQLQQGSSYHADIHSGYSPPFTSMSDGSFIMEADQGALTLIRLGSAYRRNPQLFQFDNYNILASGKPDIQEYIVSYVNYLEGLQGINVQEGNVPGAVRLGSGMVINNIFIPGPTNLTSMKVYIPGSPPTILQTANVVSLCGANDSSALWQSCINNAANVYKCQINEPCLNMSYNDRLGIITSNATKNGYAVSQGWSYEFGCYFDVNLNKGEFNNGIINPCQIFYNDTNRQYTSMTLLAFLEAWPAVNDFSQGQGQELLTRSINTYNYIKDNYPAFTSQDSDAGFYGAALFLLYDYTNSSAYLLQAYSMRTIVSTTFISDTTRGNEFYWEEYVRHKDAISAQGLTYQLNSNNPEEFFRGKMYQDYKDAGPTAISNNGERVFQFDPNVQFQNSRYMLIEGLLGMKTTELVSSPESFIPLVAQNQLSWLTGMNLVEQGAGLNAPLKSMSFIFGIGNFPSQFHSRWLVDTGYSAGSAGSVIGARGSGYQFFDSATNSYVYLDGVTNILGDQFGALGNGWHNEAVPDIFHVGRVFKNGRTYIPGWISGVFPAFADKDTVFNYNDDVHSWEYTETTNEIVATAIEYYAYLDGDLNSRPRYDGSSVNTSMPNNQTNSNSTNSTNNNTSNLTQSNLIIFTSPDLVSVSIDSLSANSINGISDASGSLVFFNITAGNHLLVASKPDYINFSSQINILPGDNMINITLNLDAINPLNSSYAGVRIVSNSTNLQAIPASRPIQYTMREDSTAIFTVISNDTNSIIWYVDGIEQNTTVAKNAAFMWSPGIFWVPRPPDYSNTAFSNVKALSYNGSVSWNVQVENVINPFFSSKDDSGDVVGSIDTKVRVLTNNKYINFTQANVTLQSDSGSTLYQLSKQYNNSNETEWAVYIPTLAYGNNYLVQISGFNNVTGKNTTYNIGLLRAHYVTPPVTSTPTSNSGGGGGGGGNGGGGGGSSVPPFDPQLIYAIFGKDVVNSNESQTLTLDAKSFNRGVYEVTAKLITPQGDNQTLTLDLVNGTNDYGTWTAKFQNSVPGRYTLYSVTLGERDINSSVDITVQDHIFYWLDQVIDSNATVKLGLVYTILSQSEVVNGTSVDLVLDAKDSLGILNVTAMITSTRGDAFSIPLSLVKGQGIYGTWKGSFIVTKADTTYTVKSITLKNSNDEKSYDLNDRSVYVTAIAGQQSADGNAQNSITGSSILSIFSSQGWSDAIKRPLVPTILGFSLMFVVIGGIFLFKRR